MPNQSYHALLYLNTAAVLSRSDHHKTVTMGWIPSRLGVVLIQCCVVLGNRFSKVDFVHKGFVQYGINGHVIKELSVQAELKFPKCSQECLLENDCVGFEICDVSSSPLTCRLVHMSPEFVGADSGQCQHFGKV